ncbi:uncharacterized protein LOC115735210 [Rhodamnia argentea]|uniref:Uncharacterized protein LOC115735210 n=1 Tax=Rhodamnia argentea TaxID=178133 RepID=A0A8B8NI86_9MYRT|nr:uncharacterized protein LOC115735210 [Rhodamnia argentea]XP_048130373.1 uncharacterized protein LOC115735210 [Rhodamnia argentea]
MSKMKLDRKPPLARSPARLRPRRVLRSSASAMRSLQTPPGSLTKSQKLSRAWDIDESELRPEYRSISCELRALTEMVRDELSNTDPADSFFTNSLGANTVSVFERGRFYDVYCARRNERLKRKKGGESGEEKKSAYGLGVTVEPAKRREGKKLESLRKSVCAAYSMERKEGTPAPRYLLRSSTKENKKPPLAVNYEKSAVGERRIGARRAKKN